MTFAPLPPAESEQLYAELRRCDPIDSYPDEYNWREAEAPNRAAIVAGCILTAAVIVVAGVVL